MSDAVVGLIGVVVGALLSAMTTHWGDRQKERREVRRAARLVQMELEALHKTLWLVLKDLNEKRARFDDVFEDTGSDQVRSEGTSLNEIHTRQVAEKGERLKPSSGLIYRLEKGLLKPPTAECWKSNQDILATLLPTRIWDRVKLAYEKTEELQPVFDTLYSSHLLPNYAEYDVQVARAEQDTVDAFRTLDRFT